MRDALPPTRSPATESPASLLADAAQRAQRYVDSLGERRVAPDVDAVAGLARFEEDFPETGHRADETLRLLDEAGSPATMASTGGRYFGFVNGGTLPGALAAHVLASAWDQNTALAVMSPVGSRLHAVVNRWLVEALFLPAGTVALFVGGATVASLCGVVAARDQLLARAGHDVAAKGLMGAPPIVVVAGESVHSTMAKALAIAGLGRDNVKLVPVDDQGRLRAERLPDVRGSVLVLAQAGEVNSGAFDPFEEIVAWAKERQAWVHVDGAFGLWAAASPTRRYLTAGMSGADSWTTDVHKWLNVPYDSGIILVRDAATLRRSMSVSAAYLPTGDVLEPMNHTPQSSQRARAIDTWAALRCLGRHGLAELIDRHCDQAKRFGVGLRAAGFEVLNDVVLNQVIVSFGTDQRTEAVIERLQRGGVCWCGATSWRGRRAMRISVSSWATTYEEVERCLAAMIEAAAT